MNFKALRHFLFNIKFQFKPSIAQNFKQPS